MGRDIFKRFEASLKMLPHNFLIQFKSSRLLVSNVSRIIAC